MFHTILFDLDGTLTDSREGIVNSVKYTIEKLGGTMPDAQTLLKFIGPPLQESFMEHCGYSREKAVEGVRVFRDQRFTLFMRFSRQPFIILLRHRFCEIISLNIITAKSL